MPTQKDLIQPLDPKDNIDSSWIGEGSTGFQVKNQLAQGNVLGALGTVGSAIGSAIGGAVSSVLPKDKTVSDGLSTPSANAGIDSSWIGTGKAPAPTTPAPTTPKEITEGPSGMTEGAPTTTTTTTPTTTTTTLPQAPTAPTESEQWKSFYGSMSPDEQKYFDTLPQEQKNQYAEQIAGGKAQEAQNLLKTYRYTRDVSRQADKMKADYSAQLETKKREFAAQAEDAKSNVQKVTNNMTLIKGTSGSSRSANLTKAVSTEISRSQRNYENLVSAQNDFLKQMEADFKYASESLSNEFNDNISKKQAAMLEQVNALRKTGELDTALGMQKARSFLDQMLSDQVSSQENYYNRVKALNDTYEVAIKNAREYSKPSMEMTEMMNQGQTVGTLYNAMGEAIKGIDGQPITFNVQKGVQSVMKEDDGSTTILYKDGTFENKKFGAQMDQKTLKGYASAIESGALTLDKLPANVQNQVISLIDWTKAPQVKGASEWEYKTIDQIDPDTGEKISVPVWVNTRTQEVKTARPGATAPTPTGVKPTATGFDISGLANRAPKEASFKNNNPSGITWNSNFANALSGKPIKGTLADNLMKAGIEFKKGGLRPEDEGNNYVGFNSIQDGVRAMIIRWGMNNDLNLKQALKNWKGAGTDAQMNAYAQSIMNEAGLSDMKVGDITEEQFNKLLGVHIKHESGALYGWMKENGYVEDSGVTQSFFDTTTPTAPTAPTAPTGTETTATKGFNEEKISQYKKYLDSGIPPSNMKEGSGNYKKFMQEYKAWKAQTKPLTESTQKRVDAYTDDYTKNVNVASAFKFAPIMRTYAGVDVSKLSSSQKQGIISDYAKALDPDSVVREGEYATVARYSQNLGEKVLSEIKQAFSGQGVLSNEAAQKVIDAIITRGKSYMEQEKNVREQYANKINKITGYDDGESYLVTPDFTTGGETGTTADSMIDTADLDKLESEVNVQVSPSMTQERKNMFMATLDQKARQYKDNPELSKRIAEIREQTKDLPLTEEQAIQVLKMIQEEENKTQIKPSIKPIQ